MNMKKNLFLVAFFLQSMTLHSQNLDLQMLNALQNQMPSNQQAIVQPRPELETQTVKDKNVNKISGLERNYGFNPSFISEGAQLNKMPIQELQYFGYDFFNARDSSINMTNVPVPSNYIVGPGDNLEVFLFGSKNTIYSLLVDQTGNLLIPEIGVISVSGLTLTEVKKKLESEVQSKLIGTDISVNLRELRGIDIYVLGEAFRPGLYNVSSLSTLASSIIETGGVNISGSLRNIQLKREGKIVSIFDFYNLILGGDTASDIRLMQGDVIFIPPKDKSVAISGEVSREGIYELKRGETLDHLLRFAGNLKPKADKNNLDLYRVDSSSDRYIMESINLAADASYSFVLQNGDLISVLPIINKLSNSITIMGHAQKTGYFQWKKGMKISELIKSKDDLLEGVDINYLLIKRMGDDGQKNIFIQANLEKILNNVEGEDIELFDQDELIFFPRLLDVKQITTRLVQDNYIFDDNLERYILEDEWQSFTYLKKSLMDELVVTNDDISDSYVNPLTGEPEKKENRRFFEYRIHSYCDLPEKLVLRIIELEGYDAKKSIPLEDLQGISNPQDLQSLLKEIQTNENEKTSLSSINEIIQQGDEKASTALTAHCRNKLLQPVIDTINNNSGNNDRQIINVFGNVFFPGEYPLTMGMKIQDAIYSAGGTKNATYAPELELSRSKSNNKEFVVSNSSISLNNANSMNLELKPMDVLNLKQKSINLKTVNITGEVFFAGTYPISENQTLTELIDRAGGITQLGSAKAAFFQRDSLQKEEVKRLESAKDELRRKIILTSQSGGLGQTSLDNNGISQLISLVSQEGSDSSSLGRLVIDLESIMNNQSEDIVLEDGDSIHIPQSRQSISVIGEVFVNNSHLFKDALSIDDYIRLSGGLTEYADQDNLYLIKADGSIISPQQLSRGGFFRGNSSLEVGDTIVVPLKIQPFSTIKATNEITQIIYQMALAAAAVNSFN